MGRNLSRRTFLGSATTLLGLGAVGGRSFASEPVADGFSPAVHGFGFRNWGTRTQYFESPPAPARTEIRDRVRANWNARVRSVLGLQPPNVPGLLYDAIATQLRLAVAQRAGTDGHCYGMVLAAQRYFEDPASIPVDRTVASDIEHPTAPVDAPEAPVYDDIVRLQSEQFLRLRAWIGRLPTLYPKWIDTRAVVRDIRAVVRRFGSAAILVFNHGTSTGHQILVTDVTDVDGGVELSVYDPNRPAHAYRTEGRSLRFDREGERLVMRPYRTGTDEFTRVLFNRHDRIERATGRDDPGPLDHFRVDRSTVRDGLFPFGLVLVDSGAVDLSVVAPDGTSVERFRAPNMDRTRGEYARMRSLYGVDPGTYRIRVFGSDETRYRLRTLVADVETELVDDTRTATIRSGELHEYELRVSRDGTGTLTRVAEDGLEPSLVGGVGALGGLALGAFGYRAFRKHG